MKVKIGKLIFDVEYNNEEKTQLLVKHKGKTGILYLSGCNVEQKVRKDNLYDLAEYTIFNTTKEAYKYYRLINKKLLSTYHITFSSIWEVFTANYLKRNKTYLLFEDDDLDPIADITYWRYCDYKEIMSVLKYHEEIIYIYRRYKQYIKSDNYKKYNILKKERIKSLKYDKY